MARTAITASQVDAKSPIDEALMSTSIKENDDDHETRILALETGSGSVSPLAFKGNPLIAKPLIGLEDNVGSFKRSKYSVLSSINAESRETINAYDLDGSDQNVLETNLVDQDASSTVLVTGDAYRGVNISVAKNSKRGFKVKKGLNYFALFGDTGAFSDSVTVTIDDVAINTSPFVDENGDAHGAATFSTNTASTFLQSMILFVGGLDPDKEQIIIVENTDSASKVLRWSATEVGFYTPISNVAIGLDDTRLSAGQAVTRGSKVSVNEASFSFTAASGYGRLDAVAIPNTGGAPTILEGAECAMTQIRSEQLVTDSLTSLEVKNSFYFPSTGVIHIQNPYGNSTIASYTSKTEASPNLNSLDGVIFESKFEDITPEHDFGPAALGDVVGSMNINLMANGDNGVTVSASNNKIDFTVAEDGGGASTFAATITNGFYTADLMPLGNAIVAALEAAHALPDKQSYFAEYDPKTYFWSIGIKGKTTVDTFSLLWSTGVNTANSIHTDLGFATTDQTGALSYISTTEKQHSAVRCFDRGRFNNPFSPNCKYSAARSTTDIEQYLNDIKGRWGISHVAQIAANEAVNIYPDSDSVGCEISMIMSNQGSMATISIDNSQQVYFAQTEREEISGAMDRATLISGFVTYPRGTHKITVKNEEASKFEIASAVVNDFYFAGFRELFSHPPLEKLTSTQSALPEFYQIRPKRLFVEPYSANYVVQSNAFELIDAITYTGSWSTTAASGDAYNNEYRQTATLNDTVDITFTTTGAGGGIGVHIPRIASTAGNHEASYFITTGAVATGAAANQIQKENQNWDPNDWHQVEPFQLLGLAAGQYTLRVQKTSSAGTMRIDKFNIYDTVESEPDAVVVAELTNDDRGVSYPAWGAIHQAMTKDGLGKIPPSLFRTGYKDGEATHDTNITGFGNFVNLTDESATNLNSQGYFDAYAASGATTNAFFGSYAPCEVMWTRDSSLSGAPTTITPSIDGRTENNTYNQLLHVKAGNAYTGASIAIDTPLFKKNFFRFGSGNMSDSTTFLVNDTRGIRAGAVVRITADGETDELNRVASVTLDTSVTLARAISGFASFTTANNTAIHFAGFHRTKVEQTAATLGLLKINSFSYLPLEVSKVQLRDFDEDKGEVAIAFEFGIVTTGDLPVPFYKDGQPASWDECEVTILRNSDGDLVDFSNGFFGITLGAGTTIDVKVTATRKR